MPSIAKALVLIVLTVSCMAGNGEVRSTTVQLRNPSRTVTEGELVVSASPDDVYATLVDYPRWASVFTNLVSVTIKSQRGDDAEIVTLSKKGETNTLRIQADRARRVVRFVEVGGRADAKAEISMTPGPTAETTRIVVRLDAEVKGVVGWFVSDDAVRGRRERKVVRDLTHMQHYFSRRASR